MFILINQSNMGRKRGSQIIIYQTESGKTKTEVRLQDDTGLVNSKINVRIVARRRTKIGREYLTIIHQYLGQRITSGIRILQ
jgi:hypothetical protein